MLTHREYLFWLLWIFIITAPSDGAYGFFSVSLGITDDIYRMIRYVMSLVLFLKVVFDSTSRTTLYNSCPILLIILSNFLSFYFASDATWTLTQSMVMLTSSVAAISSIAYLRNYFIRFCVDLAALTMWMSLFFALLLPNFGTLGEFQVTQSSSVGDLGSWMGVFLSKNELGHAAGICAFIIFVFGSSVMSPIIHFMTSLVSLVCLFKSQSASGIVLFTSGLLFYYIVKSSMTNRVLSISNIILVLTVILSIIYGNEIIVFVLDLLGKDTTFTGRDEIWQYGFTLVNEIMPLGLGYGYSWNPVFSELIINKFGVMHLHNAYLELLLNLGLLSITYFFIIVWGLYKGLLAWRLGSKNAELYVTVLFIWLISGLSEPMVTRPSGFVSFIGFIMLGAMYMLSRPNNIYNENVEH